MHLAQFIVAILFVTALATGGRALADGTSSNRVANFHTWGVYVEDDPVECWAASVPSNSILTNAGNTIEDIRVDVFLMTVHRPEYVESAQVTFRGGHEFAKGSIVQLHVGGQTFKLFTQGRWSWPASAKEDAKVIAALSKATSASVVSTSAEGAKATDTFPLKGYRKAIDEAEKHCHEVPVS